MYTNPYFDQYGRLNNDGVALVNAHIDRVGLPRCSCEKEYRWDIERLVAVVPAFRHRDAPPPSDSNPGYLVVFVSCSNCRELHAYSATNIGLA